MAINGLRYESGEYATQSDLTTAGGLVLVASQSFSAVSSVSVNNCFTATYENYRIVYRVDGSADAYVAARLRSAGADASGSSYGGNGFYVTGTTVAGFYNGGTENRWRLGNIDQPSYGLSGQFDVYRPFSATFTEMAGIAEGAVTGVTVASPFHTGMVYQVATSFDGISLYPESGTITGTLRIYGYRNS